jgi:hypothetical protein
VLGLVGTVCVTVANTDLALAASECASVVLRLESGPFLAAGSLLLMAADWMLVYTILCFAYAYVWDKNWFLARCGSTFGCGWCAWVLAALYCMVGITAVVMGLVHGTEGCSFDFWGISLAALAVLCVFAPVIVSRRMVALPAVFILIVCSCSVFATAKALASNTCTASMRIRGVDNVLAIGNLMCAVLGQLVCVATFCCCSDDRRVCDNNNV